MAPTLASPALLELLEKRHDFGIEGRGQSLVVISIVMTITAFLLVVNRVFWRCRDGHIPLLADDWFIMAAVAFAIAMAVCNIIGVHHGYGKPMKLIPHDDLVLALKMFWLNQINYKFTINFTKISILFLYKRIFIDRSFPKRCYIVVGFVSLYSTASILATIFECSPIEHIYNKSVPGTCINLTAFWYSNAVYSVVTDFVILALPMPIIFKLTGLNKPAKINLAIVFSLGLFVCVTSFLRMTTLKLSSKAPDQTYGTYLSTTWTTVEANAAITAACLPMVRTLVSHMFPKWFAKSRYGRATSLGNSQIQTNGSRTKIPSTTARPNPTNLKLLQEGDRPGPIEMNRLRNAQRPATAPESRMPYMLNSAGFPLSRVTPVTPSKTSTGLDVKAEESGSISTASKSEFHEDHEASPRE